MNIRFWQRLKGFGANDEGVTAIEYSVIIAFISGSLLVALPLVGANFSNPLTELATAIDAGGGASSGEDSEGDGESDDGEDDDNGDDEGDDEGDDDEDDDDDDSDSDDDSDDDDDDS